MTDTLALIATWGGAGALVDFLLGKVGQKRVRAALESWWIHFADVRLSTFSVREAAFAARLLNTCFGTFLSLRRVSSALVITAIAFLGWKLWLDQGFAITYRPERYGVVLVHYLFNLGTFWLTTSFNLWLAQRLTQIGFLSSRMQFLLYVGGLALQLLLMFTIGYEFHGLFFQLVGIEILYDHDIHAPTYYLERTVDFSRHLWNDFELRIPYAGDVFNGSFADFQTFLQPVYAHAASLIRLFMMLAFVLSILLRPFQQFVLLVLARLIESEKPILTMFFGGLAAIAATVQKVL